MPNLSDQLQTLVQRAGAGFGLESVSARTAFSANVRADISTIISQHNTVIVPLVETLAEDALDVGLSGAVIYTDLSASEASSGIYWDDSGERARTIKQSFDAMISEVTSIRNELGLAGETTTQDTSFNLGIRQFVYQQGGVAEAQIYTDWSELWADAADAALEGKIEIVLDDTFETSELPVGSYNFSNMSLRGTMPVNLNESPFGYTRFIIADGAVITNLHEANLVDFHTASSTPVGPIQYTDGDTHLVRFVSCEFQSVGIGPIITVDDATVLSLSIQEKSVTFGSEGGGVGPFLRVDDTLSTVSVSVSNSKLNADSISSIVGSTVDVSIGDPWSFISVTQTDVDGTLDIDYSSLAKRIFYDNNTSGLTAELVQDAIDEVNDRLVTVEDEFVTATIAVPNTTGGGTTASLTVDLARFDGVAWGSTGIKRCQIVAQLTQFIPPPLGLSTTITFSAATKGTINGSGNGWCTFDTNTAGEFDCTVTNSADETAYFTVITATVYGDGTIVQHSNTDDAFWSA